MFWVQVFMQVEFWNETLFLRKNPNIRIYMYYIYIIYIYYYIYSAHAQLSIPLHSKGAVFLGIKAAIMRNGFGSWKLTQCRQSRISPLMFYHDLRLVLKYALRTHFFVQWIVVKMYDDPSAWWFSMIMIFCTLFFFCIFSIQIALLHWTTSPRSSEDPSHQKVGAACEPPWLEPLLCPLADCPETQSSESNKLLECKGNDAILLFPWGYVL